VFPKVCQASFLNYSAMMRGFLKFKYESLPKTTDWSFRPFRQEIILHSRQYTRNILECWEVAKSWTKDFRLGVHFIIDLEAKCRQLNKHLSEPKKCKYSERAKGRIELALHSLLDGLLLSIHNYACYRDISMKQALPLEQLSKAIKQEKM